MSSTAELFSRWHALEQRATDAAQALLAQIKDPASCPGVVDARHVQGLRALTRQAHRQFLDAL